jgi:signal transduction histidine kinase
VQYNPLRPGHYTFRVLACNNEGVWSAQPAMLELVVEPFFYETRSFAVLVGAIVLAVVIFIVRQIAVRRLERKLEFVERQRAVERDRARIARDIHDDLGAGLTHISLLSEVARQTPPAEVGEPLGQISDMARELTRAMDEIVWAVDPQNDTLDSLVSYLCKFAQEYLSVAKVRCRLDLPDELPPWPLRAEVRHNLFLAFKEALNNVVKHAEASEVWLRLKISGDTFTLAVEDNGRGLGESKRKQTGRISSGRGLVNLNVRLAPHGGSCALTSAPGQGTTVTFTISRTHGVGAPK